MLAYDNQVTTIISGASTPFQVARSSPVSDTRGSRKATLLFPQGITATINLANGTSQPLTGNWNVRATEYTVGPNGPSAMPADLPPTSAYTYAAELSIDEAVTAGATGITFNQPVINYTQNFLNFPVGAIVPVGYYDRQQGQWIPSQNGRVIKILSISSGSASLDISGNGTAATSGELAALGVTPAEQQQLATLYQVGQTLWRVSLTHFSSWDSNWPKVFTDALGGQNPKAPRKNDGFDLCMFCNGSLIDSMNQDLGEGIGIAGTSFDLHYQSAQVPGHSSTSHLDIPVTDSSSLGTIKAITLTVTVAGKSTTVSLAPGPNLTYGYDWDGKDAYGRTVQGLQTAHISIGYVLPTIYGTYDLNANTPAFAMPPRIFFTPYVYGPDVTVTKEEDATVTYLDTRSRGLGGWSLNVNHFYDPNGKTLYMGDGTRRKASNVSPVIKSVAGLGYDPNGGGSTSLPRIFVTPGDGGPATNASLQPGAAVMTADGNIYVIDTINKVIRKIAPNGTITTFAGGGTVLGEGGSATQARLYNPTGLALGPDGTLYIADSELHRIRKVKPDGTINTVAGTSTYTDNGTGGNSSPGGFSGDGGPATAALLSYPNGVALGKDGSIYISDGGNHRIRRIGTDGIINTVAGTGVQGFSGDGSSALSAQINPTSVAVDLSGNVYFTDGLRVRMIGTDGIINTIAGNGTQGFSGDGGPAIQATFNGLNSLTVGPDGSLFLVDTGNLRIRKVGIDRLIKTVAGSGLAGCILGVCPNTGENGPSNAAPLASPNSALIGKDGNLYISEQFSLRAVSVDMPGFIAAAISIPSLDGSELYQFDANGRHLRTMNTLTGSTIYTFGYDGSGRLSSATDAFNNVTSITRDGSGNPTVVAPFGQQTQLTLDANGFASNIKDPANQAVQLGYSATGLLSNLTEPNGGLHIYTYDTQGKLTKDQNPGSGYTQLTPAFSYDEANYTYFYSVTTASDLGRSGLYTIKQNPDGSEVHINKDSRGIIDSELIQLNRSHVITSATGTTASFQETPDPRWGMQAPQIGSMNVTTPGGLSGSFSSSRNVGLNNPADPLSIASFSTSYTVNGQTATSTYDGASHTFTSYSVNGRTTSTAINANGQPVSQQVPGQDSVSYTYDSRGRQSTVSQGTGANTRIVAYNYNPTSGYLTSVSDPLSRTVSYNLDVLGRVQNQTLTGGQVISYTYDLNSNPTSLTPPGLPAYTTGYNSSSQPVTSTMPSVTGGGTNQYAATYNPDRQISTITNPDSTQISFGYDSSGYLTTSTLPTGSYTSSFDPATGQPSSISSPDGLTRSLSYDGTLVNSISIGGAVTGTLNYSYDNFLRLISDTVNGTSTINYQYETDGLLSQAGNLNISYDPANGRPVGTTLSGITTSQSYSSLGEMSSYQATTASSTLFSDNYTRDKLGRITQKVELVGSQTVTTTYAYDLSGRLTDVTQNGASIGHYTYDANGNRLTFNNTSQGISLTASYDAQDRLLQYGSTTYTYTPQGEVATKTISGSTATSFHYDAGSNLTSLTLPDGRSLQYLYDGSGRRVGKKINGVLVQGFLFASQIHPLAELDGSNQITSRFIYGGDGNTPSYLVKGANTYRLITDHLGSVRLVVDAVSGAVVQQIDYDEFGRVTSDTNPGFQPFGYAGGLYDNDTGLVRFGVRDYEPTTGRWTTKDPLGFDAGDTNLYRYVFADPINLSDPTGLECNDPLQVIADTGTGILDGVSGGLFSGVVLNVLGLKDRVNKCSLAYQGGCFLGFVSSWFAGSGEAGAVAGAGRTGRAVEEGDAALGAAGKACEFNSFSADTLVATDQGEKPISQIKVGDHVLAYDASLGITGYYTVTAAFHHTDQTILGLNIAGEQLQTTEGHPFYTQERGWLEAQDLWVGAHVRKADGSFGVVEAVKVVQHQQEMYNLSVEGAHSFFVGQEQWLVHNMCAAAGNGGRDAIEKGISSLEKRIAEHKEKLNAYKNNPDAYDNLGLLKNAPSEEIRKKIIEGRIKHLEDEIKTFQDNIEKLKNKFNP